MEEHVQHVDQALAILEQEQFFAKLSKCEFAMREVKFLGHIVGADGVKVDPTKVKVIQEWAVPRTVTELRAILGLCNYFRKFVPAYSYIVNPRRPH